MFLIIVPVCFKKKKKEKKSNMLPIFIVYDGGQVVTHIADIPCNNKPSSLYI